MGIMISNKKSNPHFMGSGPSRLLQLLNCQEPYFLIIFTHRSFRDRNWLIPQATNRQT